MFTNRFKEKYGVECVSALHHNKHKTNYHIHLIFSERELLPEPVEKIATRNIFYDEHGKHVRTKKEILDDSGNVRRGCKIVKKGEIYERTLFTVKNKLFHEADEKVDNTTTVITAPAMEEVKEPVSPKVTVTATVPEEKVAEPPKPQIPPRPIMPPEAAAFPKLQKVKVTLDKHNNLIFEAEREQNKLEIERDDLKGFAKPTKKKELDSRIATKTEEIRTLKAGLSGIVRQHGFATVQDFYTAFYTAQNAYNEYMLEIRKWEETHGEKPQKAETLIERLQRYDREKVNRRQTEQYYYPHKDRGAR